MQAHEMRASFRLRRASTALCATVGRCSQAPKPISAVLSELTDTQRFIEELRANINQSLANMGIVAAFMCALAANVYSNPAKTRDCYGNAGYVAMIWIEWFSMGFFFLGISITVLLASDLSGVPDRLLLRHLSQSQLTMTLPRRRSSSLITQRAS